jgi:hypothetical protein
VKRPNNLTGLGKVSIEFGSTFQCHLREELQRAVKLWNSSVMLLSHVSIGSEPTDEPERLSYKKQW